MNNFTPGPPDASLVLQAATTVTANTSSGWLALGKNFQPGGLGMPVAAMISVTAADRGNSDETYAFNLEEAEQDSTGAVVASTAKICTVPGTLTVSGTTASPGTAPGILTLKGFIIQPFVRCNVVITGTTPSVSYSAMLNP